MTAKVFRGDINGLRAVAVACVVLFHAGVPHLDGGFLGVDIFFVISGFLMTQIIVNSVATGKLSIVQFYWMRAERIIPALLVLVGGLLVFSLVYAEPNSLLRLCRQSLGALTFLSNIEFWQEAGYFDVVSKQKLLLHTWSLSVEWQFYLVYPLLLAGVGVVRRSPSLRRLILLVGFALSFAASTYLATANRSGVAHSFAFFMLPTRAWEMIAGGLVFEASWLTGRIHRFSFFSEIAGLALIFVGLVVFDEATPWPSWRAIVPVAGTALVLLAAREASLLRAQSIQFLGLVSYSVYLWHWPLVVWLGNTDYPLWAKVGAIVVCSIMLGFLSYRFIERLPARLMLVSVGRHTARVATLVLPLGLLAGIAAAGVVDQGFPQRIKGNVDVYRDAVSAGDDRGYPYDRCGGLAKGDIRPCVVGDGARANVAVISDSFGEMWYARARRLQAEHPDSGVVFLTSGGCPPVGGVYRSSSGNECMQAHERFHQFAAGRQYQRVVIMAMWTSYFTKGRADVRINTGSGDLALGTPEGLAAAMRSLKGEITQYLALGKQVVVVETVPYPGKDVPLEVRNAEFNGASSVNEKFDFGDVMKQSLPIDDNLRQLRDMGVTVIDLKDYFCPNSTCEQVRNRRTLYADAAHFRASYLSGIPRTPLDDVFLKP